MELFYTRVASPIGELVLVSNTRELVAIHWGKGSRPYRPDKNWVHSTTDGVLRKAKEQLEEYFKGTRQSFDLPLQVQGTKFQEKVWRALKKIPYGEKRSYLEIAKQIKSPKACRAVGLANGKNPLPIVIPCHRVIGKDGSLTGFGGGLDRKKILLALEARI